MTDNLRRLQQLCGESSNEELSGLFGAAADEIEALKAQIEQLRKANEAQKFCEFDLLDAEFAKTPAQCLAERDAKVVEKAIALTRSTAIEGGTRWLCRVDDLEKYANQLRQQASK